MIISFPKMVENINYLIQSPCDRPIEYKIGTIDDRFEVSKELFSKKTEEATLIWEESLGKDLFKYTDTEEALSVNLIYDEKQSLRTNINEIEQTLEEEKTNIDKEKESFDELVQEYEMKLNEYNEKVTYWNKEGGAPKPIYLKLMQEQQLLQEEAIEINALATKLNIETQEYNVEVDRLQETVTSYNEALEIRPEEGLYSSTDNKIDIYLYVNEKELIHTLAHELGHAIGIDHIQDSNSLMYEYTTEIVELSEQDISELNTICEQRTYEIIWNTFTEKISTYLNID